MQLSSKFLMVFFYGLFGSHLLYSQSNSPWLVRKVNLKNLPSDIRFNCIQQDRDGFLWIGTVSGLYRYDGSNIIRFLRDPNDSNSLSHNYASTLSRDPTGNMWIGTFGGSLNMFDRNTGKIKRMHSKVMGMDRSIFRKIKNSFDHQSTIAATSLEIFKIKDEKTDSILVFPRNPLNANITDFIEYEKDKFILTATTGLFSLDWKSRRLTQIVHPLRNNRFFCIERDGSGNYWAGSQQGLVVLNYDFSLHDIKRFDAKMSLNSANIQSIIKDSIGRMWIGTTTGLFVSQDQEIHTVHSIANSELPTNIRDLYFDRNGTLWVATEYNGLYQVYQPSVLFRHIPGMQAYSKKTQIQSTLEEKPGTWLIGTMNQLYRYKFNSGKFDKIRLGNTGPDLVLSYLFKDKNNSCWVGTQNKGVFYRPPGESDFISFNPLPNDSKSFLQNWITSFCEDKAGNIWIGAYSSGGKINSLSYFDPLTKRLTPINRLASDSTVFSGIAISQIEKDSSSLWISTLDMGLFRYELTHGLPKHTGFTNYSEKSMGPHKISHDVVLCVRPAKNGMIWFGTVSGGVNVIDTKKDSIYWFTAKDGLPSNLIYRIEEDDQGILWLSTDNGIARFDPSTKTCINYSNSSGLPSNNFIFLNSTKCADGTIVFGTNDGQVVYFNPNSYANSLNSQPVIITDIKLGNKSEQVATGSILNKAAYLTDSIWLNYDQSVISFELANMDFQNPEVYTYAYKLEGFDREWTYINDRNSITYTNLDPGSYTLLIKNANHLGIWNENPTKLALFITPPFWRTWWFTVLVISLIALLIYSLFRYRLHQQLRVLQIRNRLHRDLHDDVGATLSSVKAYSEILQSNPNNPSIANLIIENSIEMIERLDIIAWATNPLNDHFKSVKSHMMKFAVPLCHAHQIECSIQSENITDDMMISGEVRQNIFLVFKEAVNNLVKYSAASTCTISLFIRSGQFHLQINDNGRGLDGGIKGSGNGLKNMQKRAEELNGKLNIETNTFQGTSVTLTIPYPFKIPSSWERTKKNH